MYIFRKYNYDNNIIQYQNSINFQSFGVLGFWGFGVLGYFLQRYRFPVSPILLALILGPMAESNLRRAFIIADDSMISVLTRPITATLLTLGIIALVTAVFRQRKLDKNQALIDDS